MRTRSPMAIGLVLALALAAGWSVAARAEQGGRITTAALGVVEQQLRSAFHDVTHLTPASLENLLTRDRDRVVLLDVRAAAEYEVSRLDGAAHIPPQTRSAAEVVRRAGSLEGKIVVAYCSIGLRSARLIVSIGQALKESGAGELYNLSGGLFRWRNENRLLTGPDGPTRAVHAYSALWRKLLTDETDAVGGTN